MSSPVFTKEQAECLFQELRAAIAGGATAPGRVSKAGQESAVSVVARARGVPNNTIHSQYRKGGDRFGLTLDLTSGPAMRSPVGIEFPSFPSDDPDPIQVLDHLSRQFVHAKKAADARKWFSVRVTEALPIGVNWFGDPHLGNPGCNIPLLRRDIDIVKSTPGLYGANIGDTVDNWGGRLIRLYAETDVSKKTERALAKWFLKDSGVPWLLWTHGNHDCHHPDTECLTDAGWLPHNEIDPTKHLVYSLNQETGEGIWSPIFEYVEYDFDGEMVEVNARGVSLCVTPNHRILAAKYLQPRNLPHCFDNTLQYVEADNLAYHRWGVPVSASTPAGGCPLTDDEIRFIAWVLTDGGIRFNDSCPSINIWQSKDHDVVRRLLTDLGMTFSERVRTRDISSICGKKLKSAPLPEYSFRILKPSHEYALSLVQAKGVIPSAIWACDDRQFNGFLSALVQADGSWASSCGEDKTAGVLYKDEAFLKQVELLCIQHGWSAYISAVTGRSERRLNFCKLSLRGFGHTQVSRRPYTGRVWCLRVPLGNFMVRRNGFSHFSGNSMSSEFQLYMNEIGANVVPMIDWRAQFKIVFPNDVEFKIDAAHNHKGHSMWNELHGQERASAMEENADLYIAGHHHTWAFKVKEVVDGRVVTLARVRGYKFLDYYAHIHQFAEQQQGCSGVTIFDPLTDSPTERVRFFADTRAGADYLTYLRTIKYKKARK